MKKLYTIILLCALGRLSANAQCTLSQGPDSGSIFVNDATIGTYAWSTPPNAQSSDNNYTLFTFAGNGGISNYLKGTGFGFTIPATASICGIELYVERQRIAESCVDYEIKLVKNNLVAGTNHALTTLVWTNGTDSVVKYGNNSDLWGTTWMPADINASGFGAVVSCQHIGTNTSIPKVDQITIKVYFSGTTGIANSAADNNIIAVYPNPSNGKFTMEGIKGKGEVFVFNFLGERIYEEGVSSVKTEIDLSSQPQGVYFYQIISEEKTVTTGKLIIQ